MSKISPDDFDIVEVTRYFAYLDALRGSGITNMGGAAEFLRSEFEELDKKEARTIWTAWMFSYSDEHVELRAEEALYGENG